jgi:hypothetical protein
MDLYKEIIKKKKLKGFTWAHLAEELPINGHALSVAFKRQSLNLFYLEKVCDKLKIDKEDHIDNKAEEALLKYEPQPTSISLLQLRDDIKLDLLELKKSTAKKQHIQGLTNSIAENFEDVTRALLKMLQHNEKVEEFMDQIDLESLKKATKQLNQSK